MGRRAQLRVIKLRQKIIDPSSSRAFKFKIHLQNFHQRLKLYFQLIPRLPSHPVSYRLSRRCSGRFIIETTKVYIATQSATDVGRLRRELKTHLTLQLITELEILQASLDEKWKKLISSLRENAPSISLASFTISLFPFDACHRR